MLEYWLTRNVEHISVNKRALRAQTVWTKIFLKSYTQVNWIVARAVITTWRLGLSICSTCIFGSCWFTRPSYGYVINLSALFNASIPNSALSKSLEALCNIDCLGVKRIRWFFKQLELNRQRNEKWSQIWFVIFCSFSFTFGLILGQVNTFCYLIFSNLILCYPLEWHFSYSNISTVCSGLRICQWLNIPWGCTWICRKSPPPTTHTLHNQLTKGPPCPPDQMWIVQLPWLDLPRLNRSV